MRGLDPVVFRRGGRSRKMDGGGGGCRYPCAGAQSCDDDDEGAATAVAVTGVCASNDDVDELSRVRKSDGVGIGSLVSDPVRSTEGEAAWADMALRMGEGDCL
jgi:hypothetical protein